MHRVWVVDTHRTSTNNGFKKPIEASVVVLSAISDSPSKNISTETDLIREVSGCIVPSFEPVSVCRIGRKADVQVDAPIAVTPRKGPRLC